MRRAIDAPCLPFASHGASIMLAGRRRYDALEAAKAMERLSAP
eukprot:COSAG01_NODE_21025_length_922_cov_0.896719_2_plen_42_part_01